jgi:AraC family transcriptional regulator of adaptative response/methylated-DNA-[protein]-cysteine methyltransferase
MSPEKGTSKMSLTSSRGPRPDHGRRSPAVDTDAIRFAIGRCILGTLLVARSERGVCAIFLGDESATLVGELRRRFPQAADGSLEPWATDTLARVEALIRNPGAELGLPLDLRGTDFMLEVWHALQDIPAGSTESYAQVAKRIGAPASARAVARACAANPVAVAVPCHRVVRADGALSGYRWGRERKRALLDRERRP